MAQSKGGQINLTMGQEKYDKIQSAFKKSQDYSKATTPSGWILGIIIDQIEKEEQFLTEYFPHLAKKAVDSNTVVIRDTEINQLVEVSYRNGKLWCNQDEKTDCEHIHFALTLPELAKLKRND